MRFKILLIAFLFLIVITTFVFLHNYIIKTKDSNPNLDINKTEEDYDKFRLDKISVVKRENGRIFLHLYADSVIHRKRISKLFVYQNLKEIYISGAKIDFFIYDNTSKNNLRSIMIPVVDIGKSFTSFGYSYMTSEDYLAGNGDVDSDVLTRILFDDISINIYLPNKKKLSLLGKIGRSCTDFENIIFEGPASIVSSDGRELIAPKAIWSKKFNGIYLPDGYTLQSNYIKKETFFIIDQEGRFSRISRSPKIVYRDLIEEKEKIFYAKVYKKIPAYAKFMLGIP